MIPTEGCGWVDIRRHPAGYLWCPKCGQKLDDEWERQIEARESLLKPFPWERADKEGGK